MPSPGRDWRPATLSQASPGRGWCKWGLRLAIEVDGGVHNRQKDYDELRQSLIEDKGIRFIRVQNEEVNRDVNILLGKIKEYM